MDKYHVSAYFDTFDYRQLIVIVVKSFLFINMYIIYKTLKVNVQFKLVCLSYVCLQ